MDAARAKQRRDGGKAMAAFRKRWEAPGLVAVMYSAAGVKMAFKVVGTFSSKIWVAALLTP